MAPARRAAYPPLDPSEGRGGGEWTADSPRAQLTTCGRLMGEVVNGCPACTSVG
jgi:hypothetical protein